MTGMLLGRGRLVVLWVALATACSDDCEGKEDTGIWGTQGIELDMVDVKLSGSYPGVDAGDVAVGGGDLLGDGREALLILSISAHAIFDIGPGETPISDGVIEIVKESPYNFVDVFSADDWNADGMLDVVVEVLDTTTQYEGAFFVFQSLQEGETPLSDADVVVQGIMDQEDEYFDVAPGGDLDGDGFGDLLVSTERYDADEGGVGAVHLLKGPILASGDLSMADAMIEGESRGASVGEAMGVGDLNGDGYDDFVLSTDDCVYAYNGAPTLPTKLAAADAIVLDAGSDYGDWGDDRFSGGDLDADGLSDLVVGMPYRSVERVSGYELIEGGAAWVFTGPLSGSLGEQDAVARIVSEVQGYEHLGFSVDVIGDVNADGVGDLLVGAPHFNLGDGRSDPYYFDGGAHLFLGPVEGDLGASSDADLVFSGEEWGDEAGWSVSGAGDVNADGVQDFVIGAPGADGTVSNAGAAYVVFGGEDLVERYRAVMGPIE